MFSYEGGIRTSCTAQPFSSIFPALGTNMQILYSFVVEPFALVSIPQSIAHNTPHDTGSEVIGIVKAIYRRHHFLTRQPRIFNMRKLMAANVCDRLRRHEILDVQLIVKLGSGKRVSNRDLNGFD